LELCVTDDGSEDATPDIIAGIKDERIRFKRFKRNRGVSAALNDAIRRSSGEYIAVLNSDDIFLSDKLRSQVALLDDRRGVAAIFGYPAFIDDADRELLPEQTFYGRIFEVANRQRHEWLRVFFYRGNCLCHPTVMIRRACHDVIGLYDERFAQVHDFDLWIRLLARNELVLVPEIVTLFRIVSGHGNASAPRPEIGTRVHWEFAKALRHYLDLDDASFDQAFGEDLTRLGIKVSLPRKVKLGQLALQADRLWAKRFGLDLLFDGIPAEDHDGLAPAGISARQFITLTGESDLYGVADAARAAATIEQLRTRIRDLENVGGKQLRNEQSAAATGGWRTWLWPKRP
jgi:glycosyltransferase involved in cell wall biosynthesis